MKKSKNYEGNPQLEGGFLRISNELFEAITKEPKLITESGRVLNAIIRLTYGYSKKSARIQNSVIQELTGLKPPNVTRGMKALIDGNIIKRDNKSLETRINKHYTEWNLSSVIKNKIITSDKNRLSSMITTVIKHDNSSIYKDNLKTLLKKEGAKKPPPRSLPSIKKYFELFGVTGEESDTQATLFFNHHESTGWKKGKTPIVDYRPLIYNWILRDKNKKNKDQKTLNIGTQDSVPGLTEIEPEVPLTNRERIQADIDRMESLEYFKQLNKRADNAITRAELIKVLDIPTADKLIGFRKRLDFLKQELSESQKEGESI